MINVLVGFLPLQIALICGVSPDLVQSEDVYSLVLLADVDASPPVHQNILRLHYELAWPDPDPFFRVRRHEVGNLLGTPLVTDVVNSQTGVEVGEVGDVVPVLEAGLVVRVVLVVRAEPSTLLEEIF